MIKGLGDLTQARQIVDARMRGGESALPHAVTAPWVARAIQTRFAALSRGIAAELGDRVSAVPLGTVEETLDALQDRVASFDELSAETRRDLLGLLDAERTRTPAEQTRLAADTARLALLGHAVGIADVDRALGDVVSVDVLDDALLQARVHAGALDEDRARALGLAVELSRIGGDETLAGAAVAALPSGTTPARAARRTAQEWTALLERSVDGAAAAATAQVWAAGLAAAYPQPAFHGRLPRASLDALASDDGRLASDLAHAYPGLGLEQLAVDPKSPLLERARHISARIATFQRVTEARAQLPLLDLDYAPHSPDLERLGLGELGLSEAEQRGVVATLKAHQRVFQLSPDVDSALGLLAAGHDSAHSIAETVPAKLVAAGMAREAADRVVAEARLVQHDTVAALSGLAELIRDREGWATVDNTPAALLDQLRDIDGFDELFGGLSYCRCEHCRSIFGPAAYFVDLMGFIDEHLRAQTRGDTADPDELDLRARRPDLWTLPLTCDNTNERIPTLQIVHEVLETYVARHTGYAGDLTARAAIEAHAQARLAIARDGFGLPFALDLARRDAYLSALDSSADEIAAAVPVDEATRVRAALGLSAELHALIVQPAATILAVQRAYGRPLAFAGTVAQPFDVHGVLEAMRATREEAGQLLETRFVRAGGATPVIRSEKSSAQSVQADVENVHGATLDALDRAHRFLRLARRVALSIGELDEVLTALGVAQLDAPALRQVAGLLSAARELRLTASEVSGLVGPLGTLFDALFNSPAMVESDGALPRPGSRLVHPRFRSAAAAPQPTLSRVAAAVGIDLEGLGVLLAAIAPGLGFDPVAAAEDDRGFSATRAHLSRIWAHARLARALSLDLASFLLLLDQAHTPSGRVETPADLEELLRYHRLWKASGLSLDQVQWAAGGAPRDPSAFVDAAAVAAAIVADAAEVTRFRGTALATPLSVSEDASRAILLANAAHVQDLGDDRFTLAPTYLLSTLPDVPAPWLAAGVTPTSVRDALAAYAPETLIRGRVAAALSLDAPRVDALADLLGLVLRAVPANRAFLGSGPIEPLRAGIEAVARLAVALASFDVDGLRALVTRGAHLVVADFAALSELQVVALARVGKLGPLAAVLPLFDLAAGFAPAADGPLATLFGVDEGLMLSLRPRVVPAEGGLRALDRLFRLVRVSQKLGLDGAALEALVAGTATTRAPAVRGLSIGLADRLSEVEEPVHELRREALVDHIVYTIRPQLQSRRELYPFFLLDPDVGGCHSSSRVSSAIASAQLYVHRVVMNLEQDRRQTDDPAHVHVRLDDEGRAEWEWRQNYRVWEANRKVFVYPESYVEPDLRDDKTPLFEALEETLLQQDVDEENVLSAYTDYLRGFEELANLTISGAYHQLGDGTDVLHLFGVSTSEPPTHYHRTVQDLRTSGTDSRRTPVWSPWRKVPVGIPARRVSPVVFLGRLYVFWTDYKTRTMNKLVQGDSVFEGYTHTMRLKFTSLELDGKWTAPQEIALPKGGDEFGASAGALVDRLRVGLPTLMPEPIAHAEPVDDYTLSGPNWDWVWLEPQTHQGIDELLVHGRNFKLMQSIDLFRRRVTPYRGFDHTWPYGKSLCARGTALYRGNPIPIGGFIPLFYQRWAMANLVLEESRIDTRANEEVDFALIKAVLSMGLYQSQVGVLPSGTTLLATPGSPSDVIAQVGPDVLLLQGSARSDHVFPVRRLGTTLAEQAARTLFAGGVDALLDLDTQRALKEAVMPLSAVAGGLEDRTNTGRLDFTGPYGTYYREIFFHIPFLIANHLNGAQRFAAAQAWYHHLFDPTATERIDVPAGTSVEARRRKERDRVWRYLEFRDRIAPSLRDILTDPAALDASRTDPFNPHAIARLRFSAYQKAIVMKYVDNLLDWGDHLFRQFEPEPVNEAAMLYALAQDILGPRPAELGECGEGGVEPRDYAHIQPLVTKVGQVLIELEHVIRRPLPEKGDDDITQYLSPAAQKAVQGSDADPPKSSATWRETATATWGPSGSLSGSKKDRGTAADRRTEPKKGKKKGPRRVGRAYVRQLIPVFCTPPNADLLGYWDRVEDRLFKIRHCMDIEGQKRELALFAPPIDPRLLVRARAAGLSLEDVLASLSGSLPPYRFSFLVERAKAFAATLQSFGQALLSAMERRDGEELGRLRTVHQQNLSRLTTQMRRGEVEAASEALHALEAQREVVQHRHDHHDGLLSVGRNANEAAQSTARHSASGIYVGESVVQLIASIMGYIPQVGSPFAMKYGGVELHAGTARLASSASALAKAAEAVAASAGLEATFDRRREGWELVRDQAAKELKGIDRQIAGATIRVDLAERALALHETSIDQLDEILELVDGKFTNLGLYTWYAAQLHRLFRGAYNNALALARLAEEAYRYERGDDAGAGLAATYWDPARAGLLSGEQLALDLMTLERRYLETNHRSLEVDQAFSLQQIDPAALVRLRETGECAFSIPEVFFDLYYPGQFKRRIRAVRVTIPAVTGSFTNVGATLSLTGSQVRSLATGPLLPLPPKRSTSIATSTAQNDAGVFELSFRDERYMPFEGAGAVSSWSLMLPKTFRPFDYRTINDVILSISYTAEQDGARRLRVEADTAIAAESIRKVFTDTPVARLLSLRQDFSGTFARLVHAPVGTSVPFEILDKHLPLFLRGRALQVDRALLVLRTGKGAVANGLTLAVDGTALSGFAPEAAVSDLRARPLPAAFSAGLRGVHHIRLDAAGDVAPAPALPGDPSPVDAERLEDVLLYLEVRFAP